MNDKEREMDTWSHEYKSQILAELDDAVEMLERIRAWFDAQGVRYVIRDDVSALLGRLKR